MFYSTEDALRQGLDADFFTRERWFGLRWIFKRHCKRALYKRKFDLASVFATQAQFCREALEAEQITKDLEKMKNVN